MQRSGNVFGLVGAPGIGKGYIVSHIRETVPELSMLPKITTRTARSQMLMKA